MFVWLKLGVKYVTFVNMHQQPTTQLNEEYMTQGPDQYTTTTNYVM